MAGIYRRSVMLISGRYAMPDDGMDFQFGALEAGDRTALGAQQLAATVRGGWVSWGFGRQRGLTIS